MAGIGIRDWPKYFAEAFRVLGSGGFVEVQDLDFQLHTDDDTLPKDSKLVEFHVKARQAMTLAGMSWYTSTEIKDFVEAAGFVNVVVRDFKWPSSPWPKDKRLKEAGAFSMMAMVGVPTPFNSASVDIAILDG